MKKKLKHSSFLIITGILCLLVSQSSLAQQVAGPAAVQKTAPTDSSNQGGRVSLKLERGGRVSVDNRTTGRIVVIGWDKDVVEAIATSERGTEAVRVSINNDEQSKLISLKADYREEVEKPRPEISKPNPEVSKPSPSQGVTPTTAPVEEPKRIRPPLASTSTGPFDYSMQVNRPLEVHLEVRVPRYAEIELIKVIRSLVEISGIETAVTIIGDRSDVTLRRVGAAEVRTRNGTIEVDGAAGLVDAVTTSGAIRVWHSGGDVRALSISGNIEIECARGRVNVDNTDGSIVLANINGDVDANSSNSNVLFTGAIREDGRYHLKSMSGGVEMMVREKPPGFTAALSSYRGEIENGFQLKLKQIAQHEEQVNRRIIGTYGNGKAQIALDTFDGKVKLGKAAPGAIKECKIQN